MFECADHAREQDYDPSKRADNLVQDIMTDNLVQDFMKARSLPRTTSQFGGVIEDAAPANLHAIPQLVRYLAPCTPLDHLIIRPGESGGMLTQSEYQIAQFCSEENGKSPFWNDQAACICYRR
jgi:hypothetical protein